MARSAVNPRQLTYASPQGLPRRSMLAEDSKTWKAGQLGILTSGTVTPISTSSVAAYCIFASDQTTSTSDSYVDVFLLVDGCELEVCVYHTNQVSAIATSNIGGIYGCITASNISYIDLNESAGQFEVIELASSYMPELSSYDGSFDGVTGTTAGICKVKFRKNVS